MPHNKALQLTVNPPRGLSAAELRRYPLCGIERVHVVN